ncbi:MAG: ATP-binding protein [Firmicutes bacterium]|nr:ATP-binding protein [Bacillota bacterium]
MKRNLTKNLVQWKNSITRKPLILKGVRQCGKTYTLKEFGSNNYSEVAYFNFEKNDELINLFEKNLEPERIIAELGILFGKIIESEKTLIILDEIQFCNRALTSLKYFCEDTPQYHIVCAGSLLGIALSKPLSFPVGKVDFLTLYPMNFYEFLLANSQEMLCEYLSKLNKIEEISKSFSGKLENFLKSYYISGGMPEAVLTWLETNDIEKLEIVQQRILESYELDFAKHAPSKDFPKLSAIWRSIPEQLAKENKKFIFGQVKKGLRAKQLEDSLEWLISAGLVHKVVKITKPFIPLSSYSEETFFKLYMVDIGLLRKMSKLPASVILDKKNTLYTEFKGAMTENYVLCELVNLYGETPFFWRSENIAEVDFIIQNDADIVPLEVKSEKNDKSRSLAEYLKKYKPRISKKLSMKNITSSNVPLYLIWQLKKYLAR